jgi:uncharacterized protein YjeT (DUF2065 family)
MNKTRLSLFYIAGYLFPTGLGLLFSPEFTLRLLLSNADYGDVIPRVVGMFLVGFGIIVVQLIRLLNETLYSTIIFVRLFFCICLVSFYFMNNDPLFLVMFGVVGLGLIITTTCYIKDKGKDIRAGLLKKNM